LRSSSGRLFSGIAGKFSRGTKEKSDWWGEEKSDWWGEEPEVRTSAVPLAIEKRVFEMVADRCELRVTLGAEVDGSMALYECAVWNTVTY
jgi:hypothetical protein